MLRPGPYWITFCQLVAVPKLSFDLDIWSIIQFVLLLFLFNHALSTCLQYVTICHPKVTSHIFIISLFIKFFLKSEIIVIYTFYVIYKPSKGPATSRKTGLLLTGPATSRKTGLDHRTNHVQKKWLLLTGPATSRKNWFGSQDLPHPEKLVAKT